MPATAPTLKFPQWAPDISDIGSDTSVDVKNCVARADGYGPFNDLEPFTTALPGPCRGYFFARGSDGSILTFAATATDLFILNNTTFSWLNISKGGVPYGAVPPLGQWQFEQYNDIVIAVQVNTPPQKYDLTSGSRFVDLGGTPPAAAFVSIVGFFVVLTGLLSNPKRIQWSDLGAPETWTAGVGLADFQDMSDGGNVSNVSGGDAFGIFFQQESIRSITYAPGSSTVFQIARISTQETLFANYSVINVGDRTFYCGASGFKMVVGSGVPQPIGKERVDRWFFDNVDTSALSLVIGASDPTSTRVYWSLKTKQSVNNQFTLMLAYDYVLDKWTPIYVAGEYLATLAKPGLTLEQLDAVAPGGLLVTGAANNGAGLIRLTLNETSNSFFTVVGQNFIVVQNVGGTTEANGQWTFNLIDSTHIDLIGSTFVHAWTSGGQIGGSLDALPFSLDSIEKASLSKLSAFTPSHALGFFSGPNLEAILETAEGDPQGRMVEINGVRPMTDCAAVMCSLGSRISQMSTVIYSPEAAVDDQGYAVQLLESRYIRGKARFPAGSVWSYAAGLQPDIGAAGES